MKNQFAKATREYIESTPLTHRKKMGQYFTPKDVRESLVSLIPKMKSPKVLDPGCGTGEFLVTAGKYFRNPKLYGWDLDPKLVQISKELVPQANIKKTNTLTEIAKEKYDIVLGNPPYFEFKPDEKIKDLYGEVINGRVNIYGLFIHKGIELLRDGGYLAYVVPPSMNNGAYFSKLREYIVKTCEIMNMSTQSGSDLFDDALQSVMLLILRKGPNTGKHIFRKNGVMIFSEKADLLESRFKSATTLGELGYKVTTGRLVWNQHKNKLTDDHKKGTLLIWSHNITKEGLVLNNKKDRAQYVTTRNYGSGPAIVVNRIIGQPGKGFLKAALVPRGMKFIAENHVNVISPPERGILAQSSNTEEEMAKILEQLNKPSKAELLHSITGNTQISKTELEKIFPIDRYALPKLEL